MTDLVGKSVFVLREAHKRFKNPAVMWSGGKDSTVTVALCREAFFGKVPFPVIGPIVTGFKRNEELDFTSRWASGWDLDMVTCENKEALANNVNPFTMDRHRCCTELKTNALRALIKSKQYDAIIVSIRRDEHAIRSMERFMSPRDKEFKWHIAREKTEEEMKVGDAPVMAEQDAELSGWNIFATDFGPECSHVRIHPILHWSEVDIWEYIKEQELPFNPLYRADYVAEHFPLWKGKRFRSLGCYPCTLPIDSNASTLDEIIEEIRKTTTEERFGRAQDKEDTYAMQQLRSLGYM